jgi:hypothetical protein
MKIQPISPERGERLPRGGPAAALVGVDRRVGIAAAFLIMAFYTDVAGWVFAYVFKSFAAFVAGRGPLTERTFTSLVGGTWEPILWQVAAIGVTRPSRAERSRAVPREIPDRKCIYLSKKA